MVLPIHSSDNNSLWPILGRIFSRGNGFLIGCFYEKSKRNDSPAYLRMSADELNRYIERRDFFQGEC